jgi:prepilin-type N-terminal cleavage/methylation domain-containing protein
MFFNDKIKLKKNTGGFTLIELLINVSIIALLSGLLLVNYHLTNSRAVLVNAAQEMASNIRLTQSYALGLKDFNGAAPSGGWGVYFILSSSGSYIIFADSDGGGDYTNGEEFKTVNLPTGITISSIFLDDSNNNSANIVFTPPDPAIHINGNITSDAINVKITLKENQDNTTKTIEVNSLGLVDVID